MLAVTTRKRKHETVAEDLAKRIGEARVGERLPSVRGLMKKFGVSQSVVEKALLVLRNEGLIDSRVGLGTFVRSKPKSGVDCFDVLFFDWDDAIRENSFYGVAHALWARRVGERGQAIRINRMGPENNRESMGKLLAERRLTAAFVESLDDAGALRLLERSNIPYVLLFPNMPLVQPNSIVIDNEQGMRLIFDHLVALGHTRIGYVHSQSERAYYRDLRERFGLFYRFVAEYGLTIRPGWVQYGGYEAESAYEATRTILACDERPTALLTSDHLATGVYHALDEAGLEVGKDVSVVGFDDMPWAVRLSPALTTVRVPLDEIVDRAMVMMDCLLDGKRELPSERVDTRLIIRGSTSVAPG